MKLKNYFQIGIVAGLAVALVSVFIWFKNGYSEPVKVDKSEDSAEPEENVFDAHLDEDLEAKVPKAAEHSKKPEIIDLNKASGYFAQSLRQLTACLNISTGGPQDRVEPTIDNLMAAVQADIGEPILRSEDWVVWNLRVSGEGERRIRIETDYSDNDQPTKNLLYFKLDAEGNPTMIPLPMESSRNPSEALVASLQKDGEVYEEEKGERAYFDGGQEIVLTQKNGHIDDMEFANGSKTFRCAGMLTDSPSCKCY